MNTQNTYWCPLDNAAKIFPTIRSKELTTVLRITALLKEPLVISSLIKAIKRAENRFPYFKVSLRKGFFWYYLEHVDLPISPILDEGIPCRWFTGDNEKKLLIRVLVYKNRVSVECSHILTDGYGALTFLQSLLIYYFQDKELLRSEELDKFYTSEADNEEFEDAYNRYFKENIPPVIQQPKSFHLPYRLKNKPRFEVLYAILPLDDLKTKANEKEVSITEYLVAVHLQVLQDIFFNLQEKGTSIRHKVARIQVPVNLRNIYTTKTMRNFSLFVMPEIDFRLGKYTFDEILKVVHHKMSLETDEKLISKIISRNVGSERKLIVRSIPIWLKSLILYLKYYSEGANQYSGVITNLGKVEMPKAILDKIDYFAVTPPPPNKKLKINCGVVGYDKKIVMSFGNITRSKEFERKFLFFLTQQGIKVKLTQMDNKQ
jgi:NRPS condensation-like uncharacterized protein